jgi:poly-gamma-glutamate capsule biosynthesis protein CapA/YwtB (metallophosphatase superfamily)
MRWRSRRRAAHRPAPGRSGFNGAVHTRPLGWLTAALCFITLVAACGDAPSRDEPVEVPGGGVPQVTDGEAPPRAAADPPLRGSPTPRPTAAPASPPAEAPPIVVALTGDVHGSGAVARVLAAQRNPFEEMAAVLGAADVTVVNLETAVGSSGTPGSKQSFQASPALLDMLVDAGVSILNLANDHSMDFGVAGLLETMELARARGLMIVGAGRNAGEAYAPALIDVGGRRLAVVGLTRIIPVAEWAATDDRPGVASAYEPGRAAEAVAAARAVADHVVVTIHWGAEDETCPDDHQLALAAVLVDAGADVVAGHHPHVLQGVSFLDRALVAYSLGNFVYQAGSVEAARSGVLTVSLSPTGPERWGFEPAVIDREGRPVPAGATDAAAILDAVAWRVPDIGCPGVPGG